MANMENRRTLPKQHCQHRSTFFHDYIPKIKRSVIIGDWANLIQFFKAVDALPSYEPMTRN